MSIEHIWPHQPFHGAHVAKIFTLFIYGFVIIIKLNEFCIIKVSHQDRTLYKYVEL